MDEQATLKQKDRHISSVGKHGSLSIFVVDVQTCLLANGREKFPEVYCLELYYLTKKKIL